MQVSATTGLSTLTLNNNLSVPSSGTSANGFQALLNGSGASGEAASSSGSDDATASGNADPVQTFLNYMKETPAQKLEDAWLAGHHLTHKDLEKMSPEERTKIEKEMAADIKEKLKEQTEKKSGPTVNLLA